MHPTMDALVVTAGNLQCHPALESAMVIVARASLRYLPRSIGFEYVVPGSP